MSEHSFDFDHFLSIPRLSGLRLAPDGSRLVVVVSGPDVEGKKMASSLWQVDPAGERAPFRLTRSTPGEGNAEFARDGSVLFTSSRADPEASPRSLRDWDEAAALWLLPAAGEARVLLSPPGGVDAVRAARNADVVAFSADLHAGTATLDEDAARQQARKDAGVTAGLFESYPIRYWDHYLAPRQRRLFVADLPTAGDGRLENVRNLAPDAGDALREAEFDITPDGSTIVTTWRRGESLTRPAVDLVAFDRASGARRALAAEDAFHGLVRCSPDGRWVVCQRMWIGSPEEADRPTLWLIDLSNGEGRDLTPDLPLWCHELGWLPDSSAIIGTADRLGRVSAFRIDLPDGRISLITQEGAVHSLSPTPNGSELFCLWSTLTRPPRVARIHAHGDSEPPEVLPFPGLSDEELAVPGVLERLSAKASDGTAIGSWLVRPADASAEHPAPVALFIHGGPLASWNDWHWRWSPVLLVARGYAVLMPDPGLSTGYGQAFVNRGWGRWHEEPYTDLMSALDAALAERPELDRERSAAMGGSFGGYMANWVAGHTDRFKAIVTHASLWELRGFHGTTDDGPQWETEYGDPYADPGRYDASSPNRFVDQIRTPILVVHGELDHRVPISEALTLWTDLSRHGVEAKFLYFPDENHWVLKPQNARIWYATVLAFLDQHVLGREWQRPNLL